MIKRFIFHYDPNYPDSNEPIEDGAISPNDILMDHDGCECNGYVEGSETKNDSIVIFFDDGNEFSAYMHELEEVER